MISRYEKMLKALINGETVDFKPRSRIEQALKNCCERKGREGLPAPGSRVEVLLHLLAEKLKNGDSETVEEYDGSYTIT